MDLQQFCGKEERHKHYGIDQLFSFGEWTYATDSHVCIRVPRLAEVTNTKGPNAEALFNKALYDRGVTVWQLLPAFELKYKDCDDCNGKGYMVPCPAFSNPKVKCGNGDGPLCKKHNENCATGADSTAEGSFQCEECGGTGQIGLPGKYIVDGAFGKVQISAIVMDKIKDLPGLMIAPHDATSSVKVKFDGGEGLLMPMRMD